MSSGPNGSLSHIGFDLNGARVGDVRNLAGLDMVADVASNDLGPDNYQAKHVSNIRWSPGTATIGLGMGQGMAAWIQAAFAHGYTPASGSITTADANYRAISQVDFTNGVLTSCSFPAMDNASNDPAALVVTFQPEQVRLSKGDGSDIRGKSPVSHPWLRSGFRLEIGTLPCGHVIRIGPMTWSCTVTPDQIGIFREPTKHPAKILVPDLTITIAAADRQAWADAANAWFISGNHLAANELQGALTFLAPDGTSLAKLTLKNIGFRQFQTLASAGDTPDRFTVSLYVEAMSFDVAT